MTNDSAVPFDLTQLPEKEADGPLMITLTLSPDAYLFVFPLAQIELEFSRWGNGPFAMWRGATGGYVVVPVGKA